jgi:hypothetical protein
MYVRMRDKFTYRQITATNIIIDFSEVIHNHDFIYLEPKFRRLDSASVFRLGDRI